MKTDQEINEAIAEKCGWKFYCVNSLGEHVYHGPNGEVAAIEETDPNHRIPNYCSDLNAMSEAEKIVDREFYVAQLLAVIHEVDADYFNKITWQNGYELTTATARQRAITFCRTVGIEID